MGIPYSREINAAFEQVTPLVGAGFKVLQTMKDISILLAVIQVLTVLSLLLILFVLILLVYSVNPDLEVCGIPQPFLNQGSIACTLTTPVRAPNPSHTSAP